MTDKVITHLLDRHDDILEWLNTFLRIPSVSADPGYGEGMDAARQFLLARLKSIGLDKVQLLDGEVGGHAAVYGEWTGAPGKPTLLVYGHYDVQPPDPLDQWVTPPFEPTIRNGCLFARGASDVKGSTTIAIETVAAFLAVEGGCPINIKLFLEGEEESGSPSLRPIVDRYRSLLAADGMISADGGRASPVVPTINTGARGSGRLELALRTADKDLHSGRYGGSVRNALHEMSALLASLHDAEGCVAVAGFEAGAPALTEQQRADTAAFPFDEAEFVADVGGQAHGDPAYSMRERITLRPCLDVNGLWGGYTGAGGKTIIPNEAFAKISVRLVEGQDPQGALNAVAEHLRQRCPDGVQLKIETTGGSPASTLPAGHPLVRAAEDVLKGMTGQRAIHVRLGATVPITAIFKEMLNIDTLMFGYNLPDEDVHAPNEFFHVESIALGLQGWPLLLRELGRYSPADFRGF